MFAFCSQSGGQYIGRLLSSDPVVQAVSLCSLFLLWCRRCAGQHGTHLSCWYGIVYTCTDMVLCSLKVSSEIECLADQASASAPPYGWTEPQTPQQSSLSHAKHTLVKKQCLLQVSFFESSQCCLGHHSTGGPTALSQASLLSTDADTTLATAAVRVSYRGSVLSRLMPRMCSSHSTSLPPQSRGL